MRHFLCRYLQEGPKLNQQYIRSTLLLLVNLRSRKKKGLFVDCTVEILCSYSKKHLSYVSNKYPNDMQMGFRDF